MFKPKNNLSSEVHVTDSFVIGNSKTISIGDAVVLGSGFVSPAIVASTDILGVIVDIINEDGTPIVTNGTVGAALGSYQGTYTTASDNQTVAKVKAVVYTSSNEIYETLLSSDAGTTTTSAQVGTTFGVNATADGLVEATHATKSSFQVVEFDTADPKKVYVKINTSILNR